MFPAHELLDFEWWTKRETIRYMFSVVFFSNPQKEASFITVQHPFHIFSPSFSWKKHLSTLSTISASFFTCSGSPGPLAQNSRCLLEMPVPSRRGAGIGIGLMVTPNKSILRQNLPGICAGESNFSIYPSGQTLMEQPSNWDSPLRVRLTLCLRHFPLRWGACRTMILAFPWLGGYSKWFLNCGRTDKSSTEFHLGFSKGSKRHPTNGRGGQTLQNVYLPKAWNPFYHEWYA